MGFSEIAIGPFFELSLGTMFVTLGGIMSAWMLSRTVHEKGLSIHFLSDHLWLFFGFAFLFGRTGEIIQIWPTVSEKLFFTEHLINKTQVFLRYFFSSWHGGIDALWAFAGFLTIFIILCIIHNEKPLSWLDSFALPVILFFIFFNIGQFFTGEGYGTPTNPNFIFSVTYDITNVRYAGPIHPVQLYAAFSFLILFFIGFILWIQKIKFGWPSGIFGGINLSAFFFIYGILEFYRGSHSVLVFNDSISLFQIVNFGLAFSIFLFMIWKGHFKVFSRIHFPKKS